MTQNTTEQDNDGHQPFTQSEIAIDAFLTRAEAFIDRWFITPILGKVGEEAED